jgi:hypothetical protein
MIYEFITPSDPISFIAPEDKIAIAVAIILGNGKAGCKSEKGESLPTLYLFHDNPMPEIEADLGMPLDSFIETNKKEIADSFLSFAYGDIEDRHTYDDALQAITDPEKKREFKNKHEDRNRTSMSKWVATAWKYGEALLGQLEAIETQKAEGVKAL